MPYPLQKAIRQLTEISAAADLRRRELGIVDYIESGPHQAEENARTKLSKAISAFLKTRLGTDHLIKIQAAAYTISTHNKPREFIQSLLEEIGLSFAKKSRKMDTARTAYQLACTELTRIGKVLRDPKLRSTTYKLREERVLELNSLNYRKYSNISVPGLSSGAYALLSQFTKIEEAIKRKKSSNAAHRHLLLLIDEGDIFLHISWQQKYVDYLNRFVEKIKNTFFEDVQIVLTTHSPVLMSDFPRDCIVAINENMFSLDNALSETPINLWQHHGNLVSFG
ncbi:AAA family ATPase [Rugamonas rubra]|uniref:AAA domain-containing protein, putative AbiEii toxin, Type IV TA system n=1 Tax=Rugamonas rubra TaxID=758825 RepID=A0A1I4V805_9BURK|nr:AAA family ATPase [Rugamonas rubra]SFM97291.1 AAA domain-containing protein, putative AbiEii toxin, Type IV TA system [Rugamonas rubra]